MNFYVFTIDEDGTKHMHRNEVLITPEVENP